MTAAAIMTYNVVTVAPATPVSRVAKVMVENRISAVPVLDHGNLVGIITEGDLLRRAELATDHQRSRWLELAFSDKSLAADYVKEHGRKARDVMTADVITIEPTTPVAEIADILASQHINRVPVLQAGKVVGIVSRANLVQALATAKGDIPNNGEMRDPEIRRMLAEELRKQRWAFSLHRRCGMAARLQLAAAGSTAAPVRDWPGRAGEPGRVRAGAVTCGEGKIPVLEPEEARALLDAIDVTTPAGPRDRTLIALIV